MKKIILLFLIILNSFSALGQNLEDGELRCALSNNKIPKLEEYKEVEDRGFDTKYWEKNFATEDLPRVFIRLEKKQTILDISVSYKTNKNVKNSEKLHQKIFDYSVIVKDPENVDLTLPLGQTGQDKYYLKCLKVSKKKIKKVKGPEGRLKCALSDSGDPAPEEYKEFKYVSGGLYKWNKKTEKAHIPNLSVTLSKNKNSKEGKLEVSGYHNEFFYHIDFAAFEESDFTLNIGQYGKKKYFFRCKKIEFKDDVITAIADEKIENGYRDRIDKKNSMKAFENIKIPPEGIIKSSKSTKED